MIYIVSPTGYIHPYYVTPAPYQMFISPFVYPIHPSNYTVNIGVIGYPPTES